MATFCIDHDDVPVVVEAIAEFPVFSPYFPQSYRLICCESEETQAEPCTTQTFEKAPRVDSTKHFLHEFSGR